MRLNSSCHSSPSQHWAVGAASRSVSWLFLMGTTRIPIGFILLSVGLVLGGSYPIAAAEQPAEPAHAKSSREAYRFLKNLCDVVLYPTSTRF